MGVWRDITDIADMCLVYVCMEGWDCDITDITDMCLVYGCMEGYY